MNDVKRWGVLAVVLLAGSVSGRAFDPVTCKNSFTPEQEIVEGDKVARLVYQQMPVLPASDPVTRYVQNLGARLVRFAPMASGVAEQWPFNFHVVASAEINAFALPGGSIFVNLGTVQAAETEAQLAGVMAHEISHVVMRHSTCNMARAQRARDFLQPGSDRVGGAAGQRGRWADWRRAGLGMGQSLDMLHMSRRRRVAGGSAWGRHFVQRGI